MADFNFYLNRQGVQGRKGDQGEQGFSPVISVNSETANEYTLRIQNEDYEFITPNLRGNHIEYTGGTYIRINPETEQLYTGLIDQATTSTYGGVILAADGALEAGTDYNGVVSAGDIHDYVESKIAEAGLNFDDLTNSLVAGDNITLDVDSTNETITINSTDTRYTAGSNITISNGVISATDTKYTAGQNITIDANNVISASSTDLIADVPLYIKDITAADTIVRQSYVESSNEYRMPTGNNYCLRNMTTHEVNPARNIVAYPADKTQVGILAIPYKIGQIVKASQTINNNYTYNATLGQIYKGYPAQTIGYTSYNDSVTTTYRLVLFNESTVEEAIDLNEGTSFSVEAGVQLATWTSSVGNFTYQIKYDSDADAYILIMKTPQGIRTFTYTNDSPYYNTLKNTNYVLIVSQSVNNSTGLVSESANEDLSTVDLDTLTFKTLNDYYSDDTVLGTHIYLDTENSISSSSTDLTVPTSRAVYTAINSHTPDLSNYVTTNTEQEITGLKKFTVTPPAAGSLQIEQGFDVRDTSTEGNRVGIGFNSGSKPCLYSRIRPIRIGIGSSAQDAGSLSIFNPSQNNYPSIIRASVFSDNVLTDNNAFYPIWTSDIVSAGSGISITSTGSGQARRYTISATGLITVDSTLSLTSTNPVQNAVITQALNDIDNVIPAQASASNQLADKDFVNSSIATNTANFIGTFNSLADLEAYTGTVTNNDYAFVITTDTQGNTIYNRYKYNADTQTWIFEYPLNNTGFTAAQMAAINSGATSANIGQISTNTNSIGAIQTTLSGFGNIVSHNVNEFATASQGSLADTALQPNDNISELTNDAGYITSASLPTVDQTYDGTSTNPQSGVAIEGVGFLKNTATGNYSLTIAGTATNSEYSTNIGISSIVLGDYSVSVGRSSRCTSTYSVAVGYNSQANDSSAIAIGASAIATQNQAIQIGSGTNSTSRTLQVGSFPLMETSTGYIFGARIPVDGTTITLDSNNNLSAVAQTPAVIDGGEETVA